MKSRLLIVVLAVFALFLASNLVLAKPPSDSATCRITCTVANIAEWSDTSFPAINLAELTPTNNPSSNSATLTLYTNEDVKITADNSDAAQLSKDDNHKLVTEYKLEYDGSGVNETGGGTTAWSDYGTFLRNGSQVTHISGDGAVEVTLLVRASVQTTRPEDSGEYNATQTLTVCWK